jgi:hypothetical protein
MEEWNKLEEFPDYSISNLGRVRNMKTGRYMALTRNQQGIVMVGLFRNGRLYKRSISLLVAHAYLEQPKEPFTTPINLDGDRTNNEAANLMWRPRWFAYAYHRQFKRAYPHTIRRPIMDMESHEISENSLECTKRYGLLERDLVLSILNNTVTWPTYQLFRVVA